jgi:hypothetical protein
MKNFKGYILGNVYVKDSVMLGHQHYYHLVLAVWAFKIK